MTGSVMAPEAFGPFRAVRQVGAGRLGPVFHAHQPETDCLVAVKAFSLGLAEDRARQLIAQLNAIVEFTPDHYNIATPLSVGLSGASVYLVQELAPGDPLEVTFRRRFVAPPAEVARLSRDIADVLDAAAAAGVAHGRLNPRDLIVTADGFRLTGLGVAQALETAAVFVAPRTPYAAPERVAALPWSSRADIFSLAAMMFELLWGRRISGPGEQTGDGLEPVSGVNLKLLQEAFARALAPEAADRFEKAGDFAAAIECACAEVAPLAKRKKSPLADMRPATTAAVPAPIEAHAPVPAFVCEPETPSDPAPLMLEPPEAEGLLAAMAAAARDAFVTTASEDDELNDDWMVSRSIATGAVEHRAVADEAEPIAEPVVAAATPRRRYSVWWPFILGPALGAAIGYAVVDVIDRMGDQPPVRYEIRQDERSPARRVSAERSLPEPEADQFDR